MNESQDLVVFSAYFIGVILLALFVLLLDRQDKRAMKAERDLEHRFHPAE
jgi:hypothetical protein